MEGASACLTIHRALSVRCKRRPSTITIRADNALEPVSLTLVHATIVDMRKPHKGDGVTDAQAQAIGHLTINFNFMEQSVESLISAIVSPRGYGLDEPLLSPLRCAAKLDVLKKLVGVLAQHYVPSHENETAYNHFADSTRELISKAKVLNTFRNRLIHWRYDGLEGKIKIEAGSKEIEERSAEMKELAIKIMAQAIGLRSGDYTLTFGRQFGKKSPQ